MLIYDIPIRTGRKIATDVLVRLATEVPNVLGVKDAAGNPGETSRLVAAAPDSFEVYSGDDINTLPLVAVGAVGVVSVAGHWVAPDLVEFFDLWDRGRHDSGAAGQRPLAGEHCVRDRGRGSQPAAVEGHAAPSRTARRALPAAPRPGPGLAGPTGGRRLRPVGRCPWLNRASAPPALVPGVTPSASCFSAASVRSGATAWRSSRAAVRRATGSIARSCSSTVG